MTSVADDLRRDIVARVLALPVAARVRLAPELGDDDLNRFVQVSGLDRETALRRVRAQRARGRAPSAAASRECP